MFLSNGGAMTPVSVTKPVVSAPGVASRAGPRTSAFYGAVRTPANPRLCLCMCVSSVRRRAKRAGEFARVPVHVCFESSSARKKCREACASGCAGRHEDGCKLSRVPKQVVARTPAREQKPLISMHQVPCEHVKVRASPLTVLVSAQKVPGSRREWLCRSSRGRLQVATSGCAGRHEGRRSWWKNSASRQKDLCKSSRGRLQVYASVCTSRHEGRCTRWKNSASRQKDLRKSLRGRLEVYASVCTSRHEGRCARLKNSARRQKDLCKSLRGRLEVCAGDRANRREDACLKSTVALAVWIMHWAQAAWRAQNEILRSARARAGR